MMDSKRRDTMSLPGSRLHSIATHASGIHPFLRQPSGNTGVPFGRDMNSSFTRVRRHLRAIEKKPSVRAVRGSRLHQDPPPRMLDL